MEKVVTAVKCLAVKALREINEHLGNLDEEKFSGLLEFLSGFDPFLSRHLNNYGDKVSYFSKATYELVILMANKIMDEAREACGGYISYLWWTLH